MCSISQSFCRTLQPKNRYLLQCRRIDTLGPQHLLLNPRRLPFLDVIHPRDQALRTPNPHQTRILISIPLNDP